jgi:diguanylate cyclase
MTPTPAQPLDPVLKSLSATVASAVTLDGLTRPLLELLATVSGFESCYLGTVQLERGLQHILFSRNSGQLNIPEGADLPWQQTLCRRALAENCHFSDAVPIRWQDSGTARALGIQTYASAVIRLGDGALFGTLCATSSFRRAWSADAEQLLQLVARLIGQHVERERLLTQLQKVNAELSATSLTDPLTGLPNRRALMAELKRALSRSARSRTAVLVAFIDFDDFKLINDTHGHDVGDAFLAAMARRIGDVLRTSDFLARLGGDEFVVVGPGPLFGSDVHAANTAFGARIAEATGGRLNLDGVIIDYGGASVGSIAADAQGTTPDQALSLADSRMYEVKRARQASRRASASGPGFAR